MTQQEITGGGTGEPTLTEEIQSEHPAAPAEMPTETAPVLNRAERRAQAKGKKGPAAGPGQMGGGGAARGPSAKPSGQAGAVRFPRTGHK